MKTLDDYAYLENGLAASSVDWLQKQRLMLAYELGCRSNRGDIEKLVTAHLRIPAMDLPWTGGKASAFDFRAAEETLASSYWINGAGSPPVSLACPMACGTGFRTPSVARISLDGKRVALAWRQDGRDEVELEVRDLSTHRSLPVAIPPYEKVRATLSPDLLSYYFFEPREGGLRLLNQSLLDGELAPEVILDSIETHDLRAVSLACLEDERYLVLCIRSVAHRNRFTYQLLCRRRKDLLRTIWRDQSHRAQFVANGQRMFLLTDQDAPNQRVLVYDLDVFDANPEVLIPESSQPIRMIALAGELILVVYGASPWAMEVKAFSIIGEAVDLTGLPKDGTIEGIRSTVGERFAYIEASTLGSPPTIYKLNTQTHRTHIHFRPYSPCNKFAVETTTTWFPSFDGTSVPIRISRRKDLTFERPAPVMLTAYGGFGVIDTMRFTNRSSLWLSMGGIYVHAGIRGGGELGRQWHEAGVLHQKEKSFRDFIAAAEWLVANGYTVSELLAIVGGSHAGLMVGVAMTQRPDLFGAVICSGPLLDMMNYHRFTSGRNFLSEYGSPEIPEDAEVIQRYSPYQHVRDGVSYPAALFISGNADTRCDPMHARKMVARLQAATASGKPILLDYRATKGHAGLMPLPERIDSLTNQFMFLLSALRLRLNSQHLLEPAAEDLPLELTANATRT